MAKCFVTMIDGQPVRVNRRGCKGRWTKADQKALEALIRAARAMTPEQWKATADKGRSLTPLRAPND